MNGWDLKYTFSHFCLQFNPQTPDKSFVAEKYEMFTNKADDETIDRINSDKFPRGQRSNHSRQEEYFP